MLKNNTFTYDGEHSNLDVQAKSESRSDPFKKKLVRDDTQLGEDIISRNHSCLVAGVRAVPRKRVQPATTMSMYQKKESAHLRVFPDTTNCITTTK